MGNCSQVAGKEMTTAHSFWGVRARPNITNQNAKSNLNSYSARELFGKITFIQEVVDIIKDGEFVEYDGQEE